MMVHLRELERALLSMYKELLFVKTKKEILENIINKQNLNPDDLKIAKDLLKDLKDALGGN
ncbi:hypothetical protein QJV03_08200 [Listeria swaminathanii]|uniref:Uncharacterized protein n=1 Tax=Listeria swaminathanii TaxID=2713501 RepID=A0ABU2IGQ1_9LIST|nr:hypothetical protein [Listeria swaminathanii]MDT0017160.1 hypothetical protein [Listeria swaminathanii]MDT0023114.1 hypothetical protein [Listeria swaminathanii]MDT0034056.1 hypothetical protein [Listeria swaminathanii]MDT0052879.1 hypothetical protein [Listeria swaminathanii]MDT0055644.1 hypothetical protein [Listeria swaminathanii]